MLRRPTQVAVLSLALTALSAEAEPQCTVDTYAWELQLVQVAAESGSPDLQAVATALGSAARLNGGYRDPAHPKEPVRVEFLGSVDGAGLSLSLESAP